MSGAAEVDAFVSTLWISTHVPGSAPVSRAAGVDSPSPRCRASAATPDLYGEATTSLTSDSASTPVTSAPISSSIVQQCLGGSRVTPGSHAVRLENLIHHTRPRRSEATREE